MLDIPVIYDDYPAVEQQINQCIALAANAYNLDPLLLRAIREQEKGDLGMKNRNPDGSWDYGPFQINSIHLERLQHDFGITANQLTDDACINTAAAGWHLRLKINENRGDIWKGVAWYHSKTPSVGSVYRAKVRKIYDRLLRMWRSLPFVESNRHVAGN